MEGGWVLLHRGLHLYHISASKVPRQQLTNPGVKHSLSPYLAVETLPKCLSTGIQFHISKLKAALKEYSIDPCSFVSSISSWSEIKVKGIFIQNEVSVSYRCVYLKCQS